MIFHKLALEGAYRIVPELVSDERGGFARRFCADEFAARQLETNFVQKSISLNRKAGTLRGMHFQAPPYLEVKLVRCIRGAVFDVIVDLRDGSPTYGHWHGEELSEHNRVSLYVPKGFAHGFQTLVDDTELDYEISPAYVVGAERGFRFDDPSIGISWPIADCIISDRDRSLLAHDGIRL